MYYRIVPFSRSFDSYGLIYTSDTEIEPGQLVEIPFGTVEDIGINLWEVNLSENGLKPDSIKNVLRVRTDIAPLWSIQQQLIPYIASYYITLIHHTIPLFYPKNLREKIKKETYGKIAPRDFTYKNPNIDLSPDQQTIFETILHSEKLKFLLYGVTGSGKTEIYMKLIEQNLREGKQTLLLIPEIILTSQIGERIQEQFWDSILMLHSWVTEAKKSQYWVDIYSENAKIIIGTRSALFYPYQNLGVIIMDEEHDESYISDTAPRYHTREVAEKISEIGNIPLILGSGTPKVTTLYRGLHWEFELLQLLDTYREKS